MESQSSLFVNEQAKSNADNTSGYINHQQLNDPLNVASQFSPRTNFALDSLPINELTDFHKKRTRKHVTYMILVFGIMALIGLALIIVSFTRPKCTGEGEDCSSSNIVFLAIGSALLGTNVLIALFVGFYTYYILKKQLNDLNDTECGQQPTIWRLDGEEWIRYLDYIHGPNRDWKDAAPLSCFCCRRSSYDRLVNRQYGYIVLYGNGLIIDELFFISFRTYSLKGIQILTVDQHEEIKGLRIHTYLKAGKNSRNVYFDVFAPNSVSMEQLKTIAVSYNGKISGYDGLGMAIDGLHPAGSISNAIR